MTSMMRIGEGWDVHALVPGRALVVGGVLAAAGVSMFAAAPREARPIAFRFNGGPGHAGLGLGWSF